ncbi:hypothetical protein C8J57DRAFT_1321034, partial [Mycena rebaudengoi]
VTGVLWPSDVVLPWEQLTSFESDSLNVAQCLQVLKNGSNLAHCVLDAKYLSGLLLSVTPHPCLRHLTLGNWYGVNVLPYISLPRLAKLELLNNVLEPEFPLVTNFISQSQCELKDMTVCVDGNRPTTDCLIELLATVPSLVHLRLMLNEAYAVTAVCDRLQSDSAILPQLQTFSLSCHHLHLNDQDPSLMFTAITAMLDARFLDDPSKRLTSFALSIQNMGQDIYPSPAIRARWDELRRLGMVLDI